MLTQPLKERFAAAIRRLLRPIVRQLVTYGISYPTLDQIVRELFVEVAEDDFALSYKRQTDSRVALVTGINRKEISRLRRLRRGAARPIEIEDTAVTRVVGRWMGGPPYSDTRGRPHPLPYEAPKASIPTFARLVRDRGIDVPVRSVLDELLREGIAELRPDGSVVLRQQAHTPEGLEGKLTLLGSDPAELFETIVHNVERPTEPWLQRKVVYDNVGSDALGALRRAAREAGEEFLRRANLLLARHDRDRNPQAPGGDRCRVVLGTYYHEESRHPISDASRERPAKPPKTPPGRITKSR
jgi:histone H3/H4